MLKNGSVRYTFASATAMLICNWTFSFTKANHGNIGAQ